MPSGHAATSLRRALTLVVGLALALIGSPPASASEAHSRWDSIREAALAQVDAVEAAVSSGSLTDALVAAGDLVDHRAEALATQDAANLPGLPAGLGAPIGRIFAAIEATRALVRSEVGAGDASVAAGRDLYPAGLAVTRAIDAALPALRSYAATLPVSGERVAGCDQLEQGPVCIAGSGANTITGDRALVIDLGGDDTHNHSAGGAWLGNPASVTIDLGGNDRYETVAPTPQGSFTVQGAGVIGVGVLVDAAGNDVYTATGADNASTPYAHGAGGGAGIGILADLGGNDAYTLTKNLTTGSANLGGQGFGDTGGAGLMLDQAGNDTYLVEASSCGGCHVDPHAFAYAETGGVAIGYDGGGTDTMALRSTSAPLAPEDPGPPPAAVEVNAWGFGFSLAGGAAVHLSGDGPTQRTVLGQAGSPQAFGIEVRVFGHSDRGPLGAIVDRGGADVYRAEAISRYVRHVTVDDTCGCEGAYAEARSDQASVIGMGYGQLGGVGLLSDGGGNDRYLSSGFSYAEAVATDGRTQLSGPSDIGARAEAVNQYSNFSIVQGAATSGGAGFLLDAAGDDVYESRAGSEVRATASAALTEASVSATSDAAAGWSSAQGYGGTGYGELRDLGGADSYTSVSTVSSTAEPPTQVKAGNPIAQVQGDGAAGWLFDTGDTYDYDKFASTPPNPACTGTRGQGLWLDCTNGGGGVNQ